MRKWILISGVILFLIMCRQVSKNNPPCPPMRPMGTDSGYVNTTYVFTTSASDLDGDSVTIKFDWGDGNVSDWSHYTMPGETLSMCHCYLNAGVYYIKAQAKDIHGALSEWSNAHKVVIINKIPTWKKTFGGYNDERGNFVKQTEDGEYVVAGFTFSYGAGGQDIWLLKVSPHGDVKWSKTFGGIGWDCALSLCLTDDGGFVIVGYTESKGKGDKDIWLIKTDASGNEEWDKTFGDTAADYGYSIARTSDGGFIIVGYTESYGMGGRDVWLIKTDANGNKEWDKTFGGEDDDWGRWICLTEDGGYLIVGTTYSFGAGDKDIWLIKTDANGNKEWDKTFGGASYEEGSCIMPTNDGGFIITGVTCSYGAGGEDVWLIKIDANGNEVWSKTFGGIDDDRGWTVCQTDDGGFFIVGRTYSYGSGGRDVWIIKTDVNGNMEWNRTFGGINYDAAYCGWQVKDGGYIIVGYTYSYGTDGSADIWLLKTNNTGDISVSN